MVLTRHGVNSILELELMVSSRIGIDYLKKIGIDKIGIGVSYKTIKSTI